MNIQSKIFVNSLDNIEFNKTISPFLNSKEFYKQTGLYVNNTNDIIWLIFFIDNKLVNISAILMKNKVATFEYFYTVPEFKHYQFRINSILLRENYIKENHPEIEIIKLKCNETGIQDYLTLGYIEKYKNGQWAAFEKSLINKEIKLKQPKPIKPAMVYEYYDKNNIPLYIGKAINEIKRDKQHNNANRQWINEYTRYELTRFNTEKEAFDYEKQRIKELKPKYNIMNNKPIQP